MIVHDDSFVAYLGGPYGDTLYLSRDAGPFEAVRSFGIEAQEQATRQRRLLLAGDALFVLEPADGVLFGDGPLRVRRFDRAGHEGGEVVGPGEEGRAQLAARSQQDGAGAPWVLECYGVDPERGVPLRWRRELAPRWTKRPWSRRGSPVWRGDAVYVPVHNVCLMVFAGETRREFPIKPGVLQRVGERVLMAGFRHGGAEVFLDGEIHALEGPPLWPHLREYCGPAAVERPDGSLVFLRADGGLLPGLFGPPGRLPAGLYDGIVRLAGGVFGIEIANGPRLVRAEL